MRTTPRRGWPSRPTSPTRSAQPPCTPGELPELNRAQLEELQLERLRDSLTRAYEHVTMAALRASYPFGMGAPDRGPPAR